MCITDHRAPCVPACLSAVCLHASPLKQTETKHKSRCSEVKRLLISTTFRITGSARLVYTGALLCTAPRGSCRLGEEFVKDNRTTAQSGPWRRAERGTAEGHQQHDDKGTKEPAPSVSAPPAHSDRESFSCSASARTSLSRQPCWTRVNRTESQGRGSRAMLLCIRKQRFHTKKKKNTHKTHRTAAQG